MLRNYLVLAWRTLFQAHRGRLPLFTGINLAGLAIGLCAAFDYFFLDRFFDAQYQSDRAFGKVFGAFSLLAVFVAMLGLFGLVTFTTYQKTREIGIRKVLGARLVDIFGLLTRRFFALMLIASILALPVAHLVITRWLGTFAYRISVEWWWYAAPVLILFGIALLAMSRQSLRAALSNPVDALREE